MTTTMFYPFDSTEADRRRYEASFLAGAFEGLTRDGVVADSHYGSALEVTAGGGMSVDVAAGEAFIWGRHYRQDGTVNLTLAAADATEDRIDRVVLRLRTGTGSRDMEVQIFTGTPGSGFPPGLTTGNEFTHDKSLAQVLVPAASSAPTTITDERIDSDLCGLVARHPKRSSHITIAGHNLSDAEKAQADYVLYGDDDEGEINAAYDSITDGGVIEFAPGSEIILGGTIQADENKRVLFSAYGCKFIPAAGVTAFRFHRGASDADLGSILQGAHIVPTSTSGQVGILVQNSSRTVFRDIRIDDCAAGIRLNSTTLNAVDGWTEGTRIEDCQLFRNTTNIHFLTDQDGRGSFANTYVSNCTIIAGASNSIGIHVQGSATEASNLYRSFFSNVSVFLGHDGSNKGLYLDNATLSSAFLHINFEATDGTNNIAIDIASGNPNVSGSHFMTRFDGVGITTRVNNPGGVAFIYTMLGGRDYFAWNGTTRPLRFFREDEGGPRLEIQPHTANGGGIRAGSGTGSTDTALYRMDSQRWRMDNHLTITGNLQIAGVLTVTANYSAGVDDSIILVDATSNNVTVTLPFAVNQGQLLFLKRIDSSANTVTISRNGVNNTIEGATDLTLDSRWAGRFLMADGTDTWFIMSST